MQANDPAPPGDASEWDARYEAEDQVWSGDANGALVVEAESLRPGRALDVGCGEGADAIWLALQGWDVTALDVSRVAIARGAARARQVAATVRWLHSGLVGAPLAPGSFDLVSAQYPALLRTPGGDAELALLGAVAPGGTLLVVHHANFGGTHADADATHADTDPAHPTEHGFDLTAYVAVDDVYEKLGEGWDVQVHERRPRHVTVGAGARHTHDIVLRAVRAAAEGVGFEPTMGVTP